MDAQEYLRDRLDDQIGWYGQKSKTNQNWYKRLRAAEFIMAALIPFLAGFADQIGTANVAVGLLGVGIAIITASLSLNQFQENWIEYRTTAELLKREKYTYATGAKPYDGEAGDAFHLLVERVETLIAKENANWAQYMMKSDEARDEAQKGEE